MHTDYDIVIIGAGIHGAGILQCAAANGYSCLLLEQFAHVAGGTSGHSSNLIHGGLRYLQQGEFKFVFDCLRERNQLLHNAPELVRLQPFYLPVFENSVQSRWQAQRSLISYTLLSALGGTKTRFWSVKQPEWNKLHGIKQKRLKKVFRYEDAVADTSKLTEAIIDSAVAMGGEIRLNTHFNRAVKTRFGYQVFATTTDSTGLPDKTISISSKTIVFATGPWINSSLENTVPNPEMPKLELVQGTHVVLPGDLQGITYNIASPDNRSVFVRPVEKGIMIGATEMVFRGNPTESLPTPQEINYLLGVFNYFFPDFYSAGPACASDIIESFASIRVLPQNSKSPYTRSRKALFIYDSQTKPRLIGVCGGKLTSYRVTANKVIRKLRKQLPSRKRMINTRNIKL